MTKLLGLSLVSIVASFIPYTTYRELQISPDLFTSLLQVPFVVGLIYLVLSLEDKRQASALVREETTRQIVDSLLGVIVELSTLTNPNNLTSQQIKNIEDYLRSQERQAK